MNGECRPAQSPILDHFRLGYFVLALAVAHLHAQDGRMPALNQTGPEHLVLPVGTVYIVHHDKDLLVPVRNMLCLRGSFPSYEYTLR